MAEENGDLTAAAEETLAAETPARPDWLSEKYTSVEDQARGYSEAEQRMQRAIEDANRERRDRERIEQERDELYELHQAPPAQQNYGDASQNPFVLAYERAVQDGDVAAQLAIQAQLTDTVIQQRLEAQAKEESSDGRGLDPYQVGQMRDSIAASFGADKAMQEKAFGIMESHPLVARRLQEIAGDPRATIGDLAPVVEAAYELAGAARAQAEQTSLAQQQAEKETARQRKLDAETLSGTGTREATQDEQAALFARIKGMNTGGLRIGE